MNITLKPPLTSPDPAVLASKFAEHRAELRRAVAKRIGSGLQQRVDPSDVLQEAFLIASKRIDKAVGISEPELRYWFRNICNQVVSTVYEKQYKAKKRSVQREQRLTSDSSDPRQIADSTTTPSGKAIRRENNEQMLEKLKRLSKSDQEILVLRYFKHRTLEESADALGISKAAAAKRHLRAMQRLASLL